MSIEKHHPHVLLIDDQLMAVEMVEAMLDEQKDVTFNFVTDATVAMATAHALLLTVILADLNMPLIDGFGIIDQFRSDPFLQKIPIILLSSEDMPELKVRAFAEGALDYLVKPVESSRLGETVLRLKERLRVDQALPADAEALLEQLAAKLRKDGSPAGLRWLHVSIGPNLRLVEINEVDFLRSDEKYTLVAWRGQDGKPAEGLIRTPLKDLVPQLDASRFAQVHRAVVVNLRSIDHVTRAENETAQIHLKGRAEVLPVSRSYLHLFQQM